ncbi:MAG: HNH endonuclease signature motif containing protein [Defluviicoccus sp.]|nr:HNH endonuclease signature motif containing protein [Defluviicoccus sp.]
MSARRTAFIFPPRRKGKTQTPGRSKPFKGEAGEIAKEQGWKCPLCGGELRDGRPVNIDHIRPLARGGAHDRRNWQVTHVKCNTAKGSRWDGVSGWPPIRNPLAPERARGE